MPKLKKGTISKPRSDRKLEQLPLIVQKELLARLGSVASYESIRMWLKIEHGVSVAGATLSKFYQKTRTPPLDEEPIRELLLRMEKRLARIEDRLGLIP